MKILHLHGYKGSPNTNIINYLRKLGFEVEGPAFDYDNQTNLFMNIINKDFDFIIGNSLGGYIAYHISKYKGVPAICINPPLYMDLVSDINIPSNITNNIQNFNIDVIVGLEDKVVNPIMVTNWLIDNDESSKLHSIKGMGHDYDVNKFKEFAEDIISKWINI